MTTNHSSTIYGTAGGTLLSISEQVQSADILKTVLLAMIGATTSFMLSLGLKWIYKRLIRK